MTHLKPILANYIHHAYCHLQEGNNLFLNAVMKIVRLVPSLLATIALLSFHAIAADTVTYEQKDWSHYTASAKEIVRMKDAGLNENVIRAYIQNSNIPYKSTVDDILYLHQQNVSEDLICDWIKKGSELTTALPASPAPAKSPDLAAASTPAPAPVVQSQPVLVQQQPTVVYQPAPQVIYAQPSYIYRDNDPYWYAPPVSFGFSFGYPYRSHFYAHAPISIGFSHHFGGGFRGHIGGHFGGHYGGHGGWRH